MPDLPQLERDIVAGDNAGVGALALVLTVGPRVASGRMTPAIGLDGPGCLRWIGHPSQARARRPPGQDHRRNPTRVLAELFNALLVLAEHFKETV